MSAEDREESHSAGSARHIPEQEPWVRDLRFGTLAWLVIPTIALVVIVVGLWSADAVRDPEARAHDLAVSLKCPICAGESIAASQTDLAEDLRRLIADQIAAGSSDEQIRAMFVANYGEQVLLDPPGTGWGIALWAVPLVLGVLGGFAIYGLRRKEPVPAEGD
jgi:cytochrome c-type biogenesis protein CcmH